MTQSPDQPTPAPLPTEWVKYEGYTFVAPFLCMCCGSEVEASQWAYGRTCAPCDIGMCQPENRAYDERAKHDAPPWRAPFGTSREEAMRQFVAHAHVEPAVEPVAPLPDDEECVRCGSRFMDCTSRMVDGQREDWCDVAPWDAHRFERTSADEVVAPLPDEEREAMAADILSAYEESRGRLAAPLPTTRCTICRAEFTEADLVGANACPSCGRASVPESIADDVTVKVNWHELRILGMWAEQWAIHCDKAEMVYCVRVLTSLIQQQHPGRSSLTMSGEFRDLRHAVEGEGGSMQLTDPRFYVPEEDAAHD